MIPLAIPPLPDERLRAPLQQAIDQKTKPLGALGQLEAVALHSGRIWRFTKKRARRLPTCWCRELRSSATWPPLPLPVLPRSSHAVGRRWFRWLRRKWGRFAQAVPFFTRLPCPGAGRYQAVRVPRMLPYFPWVGIAVGAIAATPPCAGYAPLCPSGVGGTCCPSCRASYHRRLS